MKEDPAEAPQPQSVLGVRSVGERLGLEARPESAHNQGPKILSEWGNALGNQPVFLGGEDNWGDRPGGAR